MLDQILQQRKEFMDSEERTASNLLKIRERIVEVSDLPIKSD